MKKYIYLLLLPIPPFLLGRWGFYINSIIAHNPYIDLENTLLFVGIIITFIAWAYTIGLYLQKEGDVYKGKYEFMKYFQWILKKEHRLGGIIISVLLILSITATTGVYILYEYKIIK
jgi:hypothetical protein